MTDPVTRSSSQPCILVVEDHTSIRLLLRQMLQSQNYYVEEAGDGMEALAVFQQSQPDIVLLDVMLPHLDGFEVCHRLRQLPGGGDIPILMVTAREDNEAVELAFAAGATDYLIKPIQFAVLRHRLRQLLRTKQAEEALRQSEHLYRAIVEDQTELICRCLRDGTLTFVNEAYCRYFGKKREELVGQSFMSFIPQEDQGKAAQNLANLYPEKPVAIVEHQVITPNGEIRWQKWNERAIFDEQGQLMEIQSVGHDITARKNAETALQQVLAKLERRVEERTAELKRANLHLQHEIAERKRIEIELRRESSFRQAIIQHAAEGLCVGHVTTTYPYLTFTVWNERMVEITGYTMDEINRLGWCQTLHTDVEMQDKARARMEGIRQDNQLKAEEWEIIHKDGRKRTIAISTSMLHRDDGMVHTLALIQDLTERKQAESQVRASLAEKEILLREIHHRVKNNLQIISSLLNLQSQYIDESQSRHILRESQHRVRSMALIHEKLYCTDNLAQIDLGEYIRDLTFYLFRAYDAKSKGLTFCLEASPVQIGIDTAVPCGLILNELITNALKHAFPNDRGGEIFISLQLHSEQQLTITIRDSGVGFPQDQDFSQPQSLGLQLANTLVSQLEGVITVQHQNGTEFRITLPIPTAALSKEITE